MQHEYKDHGKRTSTGQTDKKRTGTEVRLRESCTDPVRLPV